jgi:plastocyanin
MKKFYKALILPVALFISVHVQGTIHTVTILSSQFSPTSLSVNVGDTVRWVLGSGIHTTTSTNIPAGATSWNEVLSSGNQSFDYVVTVEGTYDYYCAYHSFTGQFIAVNTGIKTPAVFSGFNLSIVRPAVYKINYSLNRPSEIGIALFDVTGKNVKKFLGTHLGAGEYTNTFYLDDLQKGIYIIEMVIDNQHLSKRIILD